MTPECKPNWADIREFILLLTGLAVGFALIHLGKPDAGVKTIDLITGAMIMFLKGRTT